MIVTLKGEAHEVSPRVGAMIHRLLTLASQIDAMAVGALVLFFSTGKVWAELRQSTPAEKVEM